MEIKCPLPFLPLLTESGIAILLFDDEKINFWNNGASEIFGYTPQEVVGTSIVKIFSQRCIPMLNEAKDFCQQTAKEQNKTIHSKVLGRETEFYAIRKNGDEFACEVAIVCYNDGERWTYFAFVHDLSKGILGLLRNLAQKLETIDHRLDTLERISGVL
jgi:PAS domain S-box-containing protein